MFQIDQPLLKRFGFRTFTDDRGVRCGEMHVDGQRYALGLEGVEMLALGGRAGEQLALSAMATLRELGLAEPADQLPRNAKKAVRARMKETGESYMTARRNWINEKRREPHAKE